MPRTGTCFGQTPVTGEIRRAVTHKVSQNVASHNLELAMPPSPPSPYSQPLAPQGQLRLEIFPAARDLPAICAACLHARAAALHTARHAALLGSPLLSSLPSFPLSCSSR